MTTSSLLQALYPELGGRLLQTEVAFRVGLAATPPPNDLYILAITVRELDVGDARSANPLLTGTISFDRGGRLKAFSARLKDSREKALSEIRRREPDNTRVQAIRRAGARYGPDHRTAILKVIPRKELEPHLGRLTIRSLKFSPVFIEWQMRVSGHRPGEDPREYYLQFEPFGGKLTHMEDVPTAPPRPERVPKSVNRIQAFLAAVFPELLPRGVFLDLSAQAPFEEAWSRLRIVQFKVRDYLPGGVIHFRVPGGGDVGRFATKVLMQGTFVFDSNERIVGFEARDSFALNSGKNEDLRGFVESHLDWTEDQGLVALKDAQPRYGPAQKEALLKAIPLAALEEVLGKLTVQSVQFDTMVKAVPTVPTPLVAFLQWHVVVEAQRPGDAATKYVLHFEPFGGKLTEIKAQLTH